MKEVPEGTSKYDKPDRRRNCARSCYVKADTEDSLFSWSTEEYKKARWAQRSLRRAAPAVRDAHCGPETWSCGVVSARYFSAYNILLQHCTAIISLEGGVLSLWMRPKPSTSQMDSKASTDIAAPAEQARMVIGRSHSFVLQTRFNKKLELSAMNYSAHHEG